MGGHGVGAPGSHPPHPRLLEMSSAVNVASSRGLLGEGSAGCAEGCIQRCVSASENTQSEQRVGQRPSVRSRVAMCICVN